MRFLLDTHVFIWFLEGDRRLGTGARDAILEPANEVYVSIVSLWKMAVKIRAGKFVIAELDSLYRAIGTHAFSLLPLEFPHLTRMLKLPKFTDHRDPFDQQLIAQAIAENLTFVTGDRRAPRYGVELLACGA